jgi:hypothetical protein
VVREADGAQGEIRDFGMEIGEMGRESTRDVENDVI